MRLDEPVVFSGSMLMTSPWQLFYHRSIILTQEDDNGKTKDSLNVAEASMQLALTACKGNNSHHGFAPQVVGRPRPGITGERARVPHSRHSNWDRAAEEFGAAR